MTSSLLAGRNTSFTSLCTLKDTAYVPRQAVHGVLGAHGMRRSASDPSLTKAVKSTAGPSSLHRMGGRETEQASATGGPSRRDSCHRSQQQQQQQQVQQHYLEGRRAGPLAESVVVGPSTMRHLVAAEGRFASLSRVLLVGQPGSMFRTLANRKWPSAIGPISLLVFLFGTVLALFAAVRGALVRKVKACKCCKGFGVVRCRLCDGRGTVDWRAKFSYSETCPLCAAKRFVVCPDCGGHYHRRLFVHAQGAKEFLSFFPGSSAAAGGVTRPLD